MVAWWDDCWVDLLDKRRVARMALRLVGQMDARRVVWLVCCSVAQMVGPMVDWMDEMMVGK